MCPEISPPLPPYKQVGWFFGVLSPQRSLPGIAAFKATTCRQSETPAVRNGEFYRVGKGGGLSCILERGVGLSCPLDLNFGMQEFRTADM